MEHSTASKRYARMLLAAWDSADLARIQDAAAGANALLPASAAEGERIEMVREAGTILRQSREGMAGGADLDVSLRLLRHLAGPAATAEVQTVTEVRADAPLGMHACARR